MKYIFNNFLFYFPIIFLKIYFELEDNCLSIIVLVSALYQREQAFVCPLPLEPPSHPISPL